MIGRTISHYKILEKLGEGGMGVVYKAEDTKLDREVAIKFLPRQIAASIEEKERFKIEAKAAAALNHANIATIYSIEEVDDEAFIVMEYIKGQELKDRIDAGPPRIDETLNLAIQIAQGLQIAHEAGVVHRDIKSSNIMLTDRGDVKIMDFGLAKRGGQTKLTKEGTTLGTVAYMSPEQTKGEDVDLRSDIFSLGVLLYEMLTGQLPFKGDYDQAVTYSILNEDPQPVTGLRSGIPMELERIVNKCLEKDPTVRYQHADELAADLLKLRKESETQAILAKTGVTSVQPETTRPTSPAAGVKDKASSKLKVLAAAAIGIVVLIAAMTYFLSGGDSGPIRLANSTKVTQAIGVERNPSWSPDGSKIVYASNQSGKPDIWMKQLSGGEPINMTKDIAGACWWPSWSPDGSQVAFVSSAQGEQAIWVMPAIGGTASRIASILSNTANPVWSSDGTELAYVNREDDLGSPFAAIYTLSTHEKRVVDLPGEQYERTYLSWSPNGDCFAYADADNLFSGADVSSIRIVRIADGQDFQIANEGYMDFYPIWSPDGGHLYFISDRGGTTDLWQVAIDRDGRPGDDVLQISHGLELLSAAFSPDFSKISFSKEEKNANLWRVTIPSSGAPAAKWEDAQQLTFESAAIASVDLSPDGEQLYFESNRNGNWDIWSMPATGGEFRQLTTSPADDNAIHLSPDGSTLAYVSERTGSREIWTMPATGGRSSQITDDQSPKFWPRWSPDGQTIAFHASDSNSNLNLWAVSAQGGKATQITRAGAMYPLWWPDGQSLVTVADVSHPGFWRFPIAGGDPEPLTAPGFKGLTGNDIRWSRDKTQIYTGIGTFIWSVSVTDEAATDDAVRALADFRGRYGELGRDFATDGRYIYYTWVEETGDIWIMDVERGD